MLNRSVAIRMDSSKNIGNGHLMRCLTLTEELMARGYKVLFICRFIESHLIDLILAKKVAVEVLDLPEYVGRSTETIWPESEQRADAIACQKILHNKNFDLLVVDHYGLDRIWEELINNSVAKVAVIDDLANRFHQCDLLLDQNYYLDKIRYEQLLPKKCIKLEGPQYALLRDEFRRIPPNHKSEDTTTIFVFFGSADILNLTQLALLSIKALKRTDLIIDVVIGKSNPHRELVEKLCLSESYINLHVQVDCISKIMSRADLAIGAGGSTTWERFSLGLPTLVISVAKNQVKGAEDLAQNGLIHYLGYFDQVSQNDITAKLQDLLNHPENLVELSKKVKSLVDGKGVSRVVDRLLTV